MTNTLFAQDQRLGVAGNIAFVSNEPDSFLRKLYIINPEGSGRRALTPDAGEYRDIAWSPDGTQLAFTAYDEGKRTIWGRSMLTGQNCMRSHLSMIQALRPGPLMDVQLLFNPRVMAISSFMSMNSDGSDIRRLTDSPGNDLNPVWSPDGRRIAFTTFRDGDKEVYVMDADGSNARNISNEPLADDDPQWSPDSTRVSFISYQDGETDILLVNADGTDKRNLTQSPEIRDNRAAWSPDGQHIAFVAQLPDGNKEIFVMLADGSGQINLTDSADEDLAPSWAPDSWYIAFLSAPEEGPVRYLPGQAGWFWPAPTHRR